MSGELNQIGITNKNVATGEQTQTSKCLFATNNMSLVTRKNFTITSPTQAWHFFLQINWNQL